ncbi:MAG: FAD-dependent oxidoreductase, partial [Parvularculaceae bacterium]
MTRTNHHDIVIIGGGAAGIAAASSLLKRRASLDIAVVEPATEHCYQPGWTMVGGGVFNAPVTRRPMASVMPKMVEWVRQAAASFQPERNQVTLADGS